jgi:hypothetical protein
MIALAALASAAVLFAVLATTRAATADPPPQQRLPAAAASARTAALPPTTTLCVDGPGDAVAATRAPLLTEGRVDPAALRAISRQAFAADRAAERAHAGPAWPQRMGAGATAARTCVDVTSAR